MQIAASDIMEKMIKKLRKSQGELNAGTVNKIDMKATLVSIKVYCDLLLEELDEAPSVAPNDMMEVLQKQQAKSNPVLKQTKVVPFEDDDDANGNSIFDF